VHIPCFTQILAVWFSTGRIFIICVGYLPSLGLQVNRGRFTIEKLLGFAVKRLPSLLGLLVLVSVLTISFFAPPMLAQIGNLVFDGFQRAAPREFTPTPIKVIDIDDETLRRTGQWPWPRTEFADLTNKLIDAGAAVIAFDIVFAEPDRTSPKRMRSILAANPLAKDSFDNLEGLMDHDEVLANAFARGRVVSGYFLTNDDQGNLPVRKAGVAYGGSNPVAALKSFPGAITSLKVLQEQVQGAGFLSNQGDRDGVVRRAPLLYALDGKVYPSLAMEALRVAQGARGYIVKSTDASGELGSQVAEVASLKVGAFEIPTNGSGEFWVHYTGPAEGRVIPAWKVLEAEPGSALLAEQVAGHIVFVGTGAIGLRDLLSTPIEERLMGVQIHAQVLEQIMSEDFLYRPDYAAGIERIALILSGLLLALVLPMLGALRGAVLGAGLALLVVSGAWYGFSSQNLLFDPTYPVLTVLLVYLVTTMSSFYLTESEKAQVRQAFSLYLSPEMVEKIADDPSQLALGGVERNMTVLFLDIRSFSTISESLTPQEITSFLNEFLTPMTDILLDHKATIDKYIGDAIVSFWNAPLDDPEHQKNAARATLQMMVALDELNESYRTRDDGANRPENVKMGIGLNSGICCVGNLGSEQRFSYSLIGDTVNLAARIEGMTKQYGVSILIGSATAQEVSEFALLEADMLKVVGRATPEQIFVLVGDEEMAQSEDFQTLAKSHEAFLKAYRNQEWAEAKSLVRSSADLAKQFSMDGYYKIILGRVDDYLINPPDVDWDGVFVATKK
jgi:adenylate cyclase